MMYTLDGGPLHGQQRTISEGYYYHEVVTVDGKRCIATYCPHDVFNTAQFVKLTNAICVANL